MHAGGSAGMARQVHLRRTAPPGAFPGYGQTAAAAVRADQFQHRLHVRSILKGEDSVPEPQAYSSGKQSPAYDADGHGPFQREGALRVGGGRQSGFQKPDRGAGYRLPPGIRYLALEIHGDRFLGPYISGKGYADHDEQWQRPAQKGWNRPQLLEHFPHVTSPMDKK